MTSNPAPQALSRVKDAAVLYELLPFVEREIAALEASVERRVESALGTSTLTPEIAYLAWVEKLGYRKLLKRLKSRQSEGATTADSVADALQAF